MKTLWVSLALAACTTLGQSDPYQPIPYVQLMHPEWSKNATIYQINTRQFTPEGTLKAAEAQLPRLKKLGIAIVWIMPVQKIGVKNRKGTLGSPYAIQDYLSVSPEYGNFDDFKHFVAAAHALGLHVILDWVANHTAWDSVLAKEHPEWYARNWKGDFMPTPWQDWDDIINLDYRQPGLRKYMTEAMKYWVRETDLDGFRCDVAGYVPVDFWNNVRRELDAIKPVFMLAEWESRDLHAHAFDMTYAWSWYDAVHALGSGKARDLGGLYGYYASNEGSFPANAMRMTFVSNHDKNAWDGTEFEQFGPALHAAMVLSMTGDGMPLIYNGQEAGNPKRLKFFEKDPIEWREHENGEMYRRLIELKTRNTALWNGHWGATMVQVVNDAPQQVFSFVRQNAADKVFVALNFSSQRKTVTFKDGPHYGKYTDFFSQRAEEFGPGTKLTLEPWAYRVFVK